MLSHKNQNGFSLVQVLIATALAGGLALVIMQIGSNMNTIDSRAKNSMDVQEMLTEIRLILDQGSSCTLSLAGNNPATNPVTFLRSNADNFSKPGVPIELWHGNADGSLRTNKKFSATDPAFKKRGKVEIESIRLYMLNDPTHKYSTSGETDDGILRVRYSTMLKQNKRIQTKDFALKVTLKGQLHNNQATIISCTRAKENGLTFKPIRNANQSDSGFVNNLDAPVTFTCPGQKAMTGEHSIHHNGSEDRRYAFYCKDVIKEDGSIARRRTCMHNGEVNQWDGDVNFYCAPGWVAVGQTSYHNNDAEDRKYGYTCCDYTDEDSTVPVRWKTISQTGWVNNFDQPVTMHCPSNQFICGYKSYHESGPEDRRFLYTCCSLEYAD